MLRKSFMLTVLVFSMVGCTFFSGNEELPTPIPTVDNRPTFPPTFTPSPTVSPTVLPTHTPTFTPTVTLTLTPTIAPVDTATATASPTATLTWTPDLSTSTPGGPGSGNGNGDGGQGATDCLGTSIGENLLLNGGFEGGLVVQQDYPSINAPEEWEPFWLPEGTSIDYDSDNTDGYRLPDMTVITSNPPFDIPLRIRSGDQAFYLSGANKVFDGGIRQQVRVEVGQPYCLSGFAHAWSSHKADDPTESLLETEDDTLNIGFYLGIDPTGGTNPWADTVRWGQVDRIYDAYRAIPSLRATSENDIITVFVRGSTRWRFDHNDLFFDDITLFRLDS